jgi:hypothetical protein
MTSQTKGSSEGLIDLIPRSEDGYLDLNGQPSVRRKRPKPVEWGPN